MTRQEVLMQKVRSGTATPAEVDELKILSTPTGTSASTLGITPLKPTRELQQELQNIATSELARAKQKAEIENTLPSGIPVPESAYKDLPDDSGTASDTRIKPVLERLAKGNYSDFNRFTSSEPNYAAQYNVWGKNIKDKSTQQNDFSAYPIIMKNTQQAVTPATTSVVTKPVVTTAPVESGESKKTKSQKFKDIAKTILEAFQAVEYAKAGVSKPTAIEQRQALEANKEERDYIEKLMKQRSDYEEAAEMRKNAAANKLILDQINAINAKNQAGIALNPQEKLLQRESNIGQGSSITQSWRQ